MRAVVQRVSSASVTVSGELVGRIGAGLMVLLGVAASDGPDDVAYVTGKIYDLRIFNDEEGKMNRSIGEIGGSVLVVSQFTLLGDCRRGRRPSFDAAGAPALAERLYEDVVQSLRGRGVTVETGVFRANMQVALVNDGPVTLLLDSTRGF